MASSSSSNPSLLGPPVLSKSTTTSLSSTKETTPDPFIALLDDGFGAKTNVPEPTRGFTENGSATFTSSGSPCVDFFFQVVPTTPSSMVVSLLTAAWKHDPLTALKLLCHLRGVRGTGKSDKERFYAGALWLHRNHPKTLALNVASFAKFGYMKDLLEILFRLLHGDEIREEMKKKRAESQGTKRRAGLRRPRIRFSRSSRRMQLPSPPPKATLADFISAKIAEVKIKNSIQEEEPAASDPKPDPAVSDTNPDPAFSHQEPEEEAGQKKVPKIKNLKKQKKIISLAKKAIARHTGDSKYQFLYNRVAEFFAAMLASDLKQLNSGKIQKIGLAAKWCPSLDKSFDRSTLLCEAIARIMFPRNSDPEYEFLAEQHYVYRVRNRLRREVLVPIRKVLELPEVYMSSQRWADLPYSRVASVAMKRYKKLFKKHDEKRFDEYLSKVEEGKVKISAGALLPHEIAAPAYRGVDDKVAELQWQRMVDDLLEKGTLSNCISVCDVSGSMSGTPMEVCIALGVLVSELSEEPWKGKVITFHENPSIQIISGKSLKEKMSFVRRMDWGMSTDFQAVFDQILDTAVRAKIKPEGMVKKVFVFSDMEFNEARGAGYSFYRSSSESNSWETDYEVICKKFEARGYGNAVPEIVFWNLRDSRSTPVTANQNGVALVSGFSKNLLKIFLEGKSAPNPEEVMMEAISGEEYQKLVVFD
ncbi:plant/protein [Rhynchospora pubera]|uniref:Plant/protein n=1 Tax=Rhynchospora pubera TaxID=906938 RepID=A0AAV8F5V3_9POAL|nr:plant/protein [Rhynchospora pubera]